jgi:hypothetical protein
MKSEDLHHPSSRCMQGWTTCWGQIRNRMAVAVAFKPLKSSVVIARFISMITDHMERRVTVNNNRDVGDQ